MDSGLRTLALLPDIGHTAKPNVRERFSGIVLCSGCSRDARCFLLIGSLRDVARLFDQAMALFSRTAHALLRAYQIRMRQKDSDRPCGLGREIVSRQYLCLVIRPLRFAFATSLQLRPINTFCGH
jgi:hypothetical protein